MWKKNFLTNAPKYTEQPTMAYKTPEKQYPLWPLIVSKGKETKFLFFVIQHERTRLTYNLQWNNLSRCSVFEIEQQQKWPKNFLKEIKRTNVLRWRKESHQWFRQQQSKSTHWQKRDEFEVTVLHDDDLTNSNRFDCRGSSESKIVDMFSSASMQNWERWRMTEEQVHKRLASSLLFFPSNRKWEKKKKPRTMSFFLYLFVNMIRKSFIRLNADLISSLCYRSWIG